MRVERDHPPRRHEVRVVPPSGWVQHLEVVFLIWQQLQPFGIFY